MSSPQLDSFQAILSEDFDLSTLTGSFQALNGPGGFSDNLKMLKVYNGSGVGVDISYDGVNKHDFWPSGATIIFDFQANHSDNPPYGSGTLNGRLGQIVWGRTAAHPTFLNMSGYR